MTSLYCWFISRVKSEEGAALTEYALLVALIAVAALTAITLLGTNVTSLFNTIAGKI